MLCECEIDLRLIRPENLEFVDENAGCFETNPHTLRFDWPEVQFAVRAPIFFPSPKSLQFIPSGLKLCDQLATALLQRMVAGIFGMSTAKFDIFKGRSHGIVIADRDGIELVIMATSAPDRDAHHGGADRLHDLIKAIGSCLTNGCGFTPNGR